MSNKIKAALAQLDPNNSDHWTQDGQPRLDAPGLAGQFKRAEVSAAAPFFSRTAPDLGDDEVDNIDGIVGPAGCDGVDGEDGEPGPHGEFNDDSEPTSAFSMKASDFGGGVTETSKLVSVNTELPVDSAEFMDKANAALAEADKAIAAAQALKDRAEKQRDQALLAHEAAELHDPDRVQNNIMKFLKSTQPSKDKAPPVAPIDAAMARKFSRPRPAYPTKGE